MLRFSSPLTRTLVSIAFLALVPLLFFGRFLIAHQTLAYDDLAYWFFPWKSLLYRLAQQGHVSFWLPYEFCGMPHMADIQRQLFYPPNVLFYLIPTGPAMVMFVGLHFFIAMVLMYAWLRSLRPSDPLGAGSALCGAIIFGFSAFPVLHLSQLPMLGSYVWIPGLLGSVERYWRESLAQRRPAVIWLVAGTVFLCLMLLGGAPQMVYIGSVATGLYGLYLVADCRDGASLRSVAHIVAWALTVPVAAMALGAVQIVPMLELTSFTTREPAVTSAYSSIDTAAPKMLWTLLNPYALGNPMVAGTWHGGYTFHETCFYVGLVTLVLVFASLCDVERNGGRTVFFLLLAASGIIVSLGNHVFGLHDVMRRVLPLFGKFRVPPRWMVLTVIGVSVLGAYGVSALSRYRSPRERAALAGLAPLAAASVSALLLWALLVRAQQQLNFPSTDLVIASALLIGTLISAAMGRFPGFAGWGTAGLVMLVTIDLLTFSARYVKGQASPAGSPDLAVLHTPALLHGRVMTHSAVEIPTQVATWCAALGVRNIQGTNPLFLRRYIDYLYFSQTDDTPAANDTGFMHHNGFFVMTPLQSAMTRILDLRHVIEYLPPGETPPPHVRTFPLTTGGALWIRNVPGALGRVWAVPSYRVVTTEKQTLEDLRSRRFIPDRVALLSRPPGFTLPPPRPHERLKVSLDQDEDDALGATASLAAPALVVFSEIDYPGWDATVDGRPAPIVRVDDILRGVYCPAGLHHLAMVYRPRSFRLGLLITALTMVGGALLLIHEYRRARR